MAVKTITIDLEAYERLAKEKKEGESFSQVIKRVLRPRYMSATGLLKAVEMTALAEGTLDRIEEVVRGRNQDMVSARRLDA